MSSKHDYNYIDNIHNDIKQEQIISDFLEENKFYENLIKNSSEFKREYDLDQQMKGIDVKITNCDGDSHYIDEKSALHWINKPLTTFAFEINYYYKNNNKCRLNDGWLYDANKVTTYYILIWIKSKNPLNLDRYKLADSLTTSMIEELECYLIKRDDILTYLESHGVYKDIAIKTIKEMRSKNLSKKDFISNNIDKTDSKLSFRISYQYKEEPANILIKKEALKILAKRIYHVFPDKIIQKKP